MPSAQQSFTSGLQTPLLRPFACPLAWPLAPFAPPASELQCAVARLDRADDAFLDHVRRQSVERALERVARVDVLAVDPGLAILPVDVVAKQHLVELVHVRIVREHDVAGVVEREAIVFDRAAPAADAVVLLDQDRVLAEMIGGAEAGRSGADHDASCACRFAVAAHRFARRAIALRRSVRPCALRSRVPRRPAEHTLASSCCRSARSAGPAARARSQPRRTLPAFRPGRRYRRTARRRP